MEAANLNIRTDKEIKAQAERIFDELGMNMSTAVNIFLRQAIRMNGMPFDVRLPVPNATTAAAIEEGRAIVHDSSVKAYSSIDDLRKALDV